MELMVLFLLMHFRVFLLVRGCKPGAVIFILAVNLVPLTRSSNLEAEIFRIK